MKCRQSETRPPCRVLFLQGSNIFKLASFDESVNYIFDGGFILAVHLLQCDKLGCLTSNQSGHISITI